MSSPRCNVLQCVAVYRIVRFVSHTAYRTLHIAHFVSCVACEMLRANFKDALVNASTTFVSTTGRPAALPSGHRWVGTGL